MSVFMLFICTWFADNIAHWSTGLNRVVPVYYRIPVGLFLIALSYSIQKRSDIDLFRNPGNYDKPVRHGIYQYCRHPMYLGDILFHLGLGALSLSGLAWILIGLTTLLYIYLSRYEEELLLKKYGEEYYRYMISVPRWFPNIFFFVTPNDPDVRLSREKNSLKFIIFYSLVSESTLTFKTKYFLLSSAGKNI